MLMIILSRISKNVQGAEEVENILKRWVNINKTTGLHLNCL